MSRAQSDLRHRNLTTRLRAHHCADPMREFDRLPPVLRGWVAQAALPWSARSVRKAWRTALAAHHGCEHAALAHLDALEARTLARDGLPRGTDRRSFSRAAGR